MPTSPMTVQPCIPTTWKTVWLHPQAPLLLPSNTTQSGQVSIITYPANRNGLRPETRYTYAPKYANYYNLSGVKTQASTPVWLKTEEKYCINSNAFNGVCAGNDEVITRYEYQHDNLHLTGMTVTDNTGKTLRTCYQYDIYGNRIGETQPNANLTSCN